MKRPILKYSLSVLLVLFALSSCDKVEDAVSITKNYDDLEFPGATGTVQDEPELQEDGKTTLYPTYSERIISIKDPEFEDLQKYADRVKSYSFESAALFSTITNAVEDEDIYIKDLVFESVVSDSVGTAIKQQKPYYVDGLYHVNSPHTSPAFNKLIFDLMGELLKRRDVKLTIKGKTNAMPGREFNHTIQFTKAKITLKTLDF